RLTNTAQGDFIVLGAFGAIAALVALGPLVPAPQLALVLAGLLLLPAAFGAAIVIQNALLELFSADPRSIETGGLNTASVTLPGGITVGLLPLAIFVLAVAATAGLQWLFGSTALGRSFRAVSDDREIAELMGLDAKKVYGLATAIAFVLIAAAGMLQGMRTTVSPADGPVLLLFAFEAVIIGGM